MPLHFIDPLDPDEPAWGETMLDVYFLSEWDKSHPDPSVSNESPAHRRRRLLRQFLALGVEGRKPYEAGSSRPSPTCTQAQIDNILRPVRPEVLRIFGHNAGTDRGCWLRLCYTNEEGHNALWAANKQAEWVSEQAVVLDDESIFSGLSLAAALEIFPERVTNQPVNIEFREESLREAKEQTESGSLDEFPLEAYVLYQADSVVTHIFVEDEVAANGGGLLHVFLDDRGNVVRQWRVEDGEDEMYDGSWFESVWKGDFEGGRGEVGPAYREGERIASPTISGFEPWRA